MRLWEKKFIKFVDIFKAMRDFNMLAVNAKLWEIVKDLLIFDKL